MNMQDSGQSRPFERRPADRKHTHLAPDFALGGEPQFLEGGPVLLPFLDRLDVEVRRLRIESRDSFSGVS